MLLLLPALEVAQPLGPDPSSGSSALSSLTPDHAGALGGQSSFRAQLLCVTLLWLSQSGNQSFLPLK